MNILIVEDEPINAKLARVVLAYEGHTVTEVLSAEQAIPAIQVRKPHLLVLDLTLPGMDGLTLVRKLKEDPTTRDILIIAVTAHTNRWTRSKAIDAGCDAYLIKPLGTRQLCDQVADLALKLI